MGDPLLSNVPKAAAQGALNQARVLGGSLGLSVATIVLNKKLRNGLNGVLDSVQIKSLEQAFNTISTLSPTAQNLVADLYTNAFNEQMRICTYLSAVALLAAISTYQKNPAPVAAMKEKRNPSTAESSYEGTNPKHMLDAKPVQSESGYQRAEAA